MHSSLGLFAAVADLDQVPGFWKRIGECTDGIIVPPSYFPSGKLVFLMLGNPSNWHLLDNLLITICSCEGDKHSQLRCCIKAQCHVEIGGTTKDGDCKTQTYCADKHIISSEGIPQHQQFYQEFVTLVFTHGVSKKLAANGL